MFTNNLMWFRKILNTLATSLATVTFLLIGFSPVSVYANTTSNIMAPGDAAVTGFSLTVNPSNSSENIIDLNGPSVRIISLPGSGPFGLVNAQKHFTVTARYVGQVFGIALDDQPQPDIFVAATSAYGLAIYKVGVGRLQKGEADAQFIPGQFGPAAQGGGPGSIWRIDGKSGSVTLFANVTYNGVENTPASLGALAFDSASQQLFVADRATGMIHRFSMSGADNGVYDHGVQGLSAAGQPPVPFDSATLVDIKSPSFDTNRPETWGFVPKERRVFALAVYAHRLYYSVSGSQIWSVGLAADGSFANDARFEIDSPVLTSDTEISSIAFDERGFMTVAERGAPTGDPGFISVANGGQNRVKRFAPRTPDASSPAFWTSPADEYAIGMLPDYKNADGGVDLSCSHTVWATGERLLETSNANSNNITHIDGLQGNDVSLVKPANMPPQQSWFINYYDIQADPNSRGHMGAITLLKNCGGYALPPIGFACPAGTFWFEGACLIPPTCPSGTTFRNGLCIWVDCPWGLVRINHHCVKPPRICPYGTVYFNDHCIPTTCPPGLEQTRQGYCHCPRNLSYRDGRCVPPPTCPRNETYVNGRCVPPHVCPRNETYVDGRCVPPHVCPRNETYVDGRCVPPHVCPRNETYVNGRCVPPHTCGRDQKYVNGNCVPLNPCKSGEVLRRGHCYPTKTVLHCPTGQIMQNGHCITINQRPPLHHYPVRYPNLQIQPGYPINRGYIQPNTPTRPVAPARSAPVQQQQFNYMAVPR